MLVAQKRKHVHKTRQEKCQALKDIEKGLPNKDVATTYGVPKIPYLHGPRIKIKFCHH